MLQLDFQRNDIEYSDSHEYERKDKDSKIDYDELIDKIIQHKLDKKEFNRSKLSFSDLENLRKLLKKEKLYYDFLR